jgi:hypothetical protein
MFTFTAVDVIQRVLGGGSIVATVNESTHAVTAWLKLRQRPAAVVGFPRVLR